VISEPDEEPMGAIEWGRRSGSGVRSKKEIKAKIYDPNAGLKNKSSYDIVKNDEKQPESRKSKRKLDEGSLESNRPLSRDMQHLWYRVEHIKSSPVLPKNNIFP